jgi:hypothetical protein
MSALSIAALAVSAALTLLSGLALVLAVRAITALHDDARAERRHHEARVDAMLTRQGALTVSVPLAPAAVPARNPGRRLTGEDLEYALNEELRRVNAATGIDDNGDPVAIYDDALPT